MRLTKTVASNPPRTPPRTVGDYLALVWATGFFAGYAPIAPGTAGSAVVAALYYAAGKFGLFEPFALDAVWGLLLAAMLVSYTGVWAADRAVNFFGAKDPNEVVIDEFAGQLIAYLFLPLVPKLAALKGGFELWVIAGFVTFRVFDVLKPYPAQQCEALRGGLGVMADDIVAGVQSGVTLLTLAKLVEYVVLT
ncbi:MAG: phosphatidylglycerophosphatase A [Chloracidobacterium sp.]|nr:phosphatidylglycerophosphatase A [Chloracidobacterium sp.]MDW8217893.1 phosphatidylglycerophosphatase A [Acidobacteriota bacterium]